MAWFPLPRRIAFALVAAAIGASEAAAEPSERLWRFDVALDGRAIGEHTFRVIDRGKTIEVDSRASFDVRVLGFSFYTYEHHAKERWKGGCLESLESRTNDNGTIEEVTGALRTDGFAVTRAGATTILPACTMTFAYWNPAMRAQGRLLNPQTGEYIEVEVEPGADPGTNGVSRYVVRGPDLEIALSYELSGDRWLALDSKASNGGVLSYRIAASPEESVDARVPRADLTAD